MTEIKKKARLEWVDSARAIGIIFVVLGHHHHHVLYSYIYTFHMPLFFFLSGMMFNRKSHQTFSNYALNRAKSLLIPYFIFSFSLFGLWWFLGRFLDASVIEGYSLTKNFVGIFYAQGQLEYMRWGVEMWFLPCLFLTSLMYYWLSPVSRLKQILIIILCAVLGFNLPILLNYRMPWSLDVALIAVGFFWLGNILKSMIMNYEPRWENVALLLILFSASLYTYQLQIHRVDMYQAIYGDHLLFYLSAITGVMFYVLLAKCLPAVGIWLFIGANSLVIYMLHMRALTVIHFIFGHFPSIQLDESTVLGALMISMLQIVILIPVVLILNRYLPFLLGRGRYVPASNYDKTANPA